MDDYKKFIKRFYPTGFIFLCGIVVIIFAGLGFMYVQQGVTQKDLDKQIVNLSAIVSKPTPSGRELEQKYEATLKALSPINDTEVIPLLVEMAEKSRIDISEGNNKFVVPPATYGEAKVGGHTYKLINFKGIIVQGDHENVMDFIADLDSGATLENMVLTRLVTTEVEVTATGEEARRREEYRKVIEAVKAMMSDNGLSVLNNPIHQSAGTATRFMGDDPDTENMVEGFPDITTPPSQRGYTGSGIPRDGYVLYGHDKIPVENPDSFMTVNYIDIPVTSYYYTCESDGEVRQWGGPYTDIARRYLGSGEEKFETKAVLDISIYYKS